MTKRVSCTYTQLREEYYRVSNIRAEYAKEKGVDLKVIQYLDLLLQKASFALGDLDFQKMEDAYAALSNVVYEQII